MEVINSDGIKIPLFNNRIESKPCEINCEKHGKVVAEMLILGGVEREPTCPLCEVEREKEEKEREELAKIERQKEVWKSRNIEPEYRDKTLEDYEPLTVEQEKALKAVKRMIDVKKGKVILLGSNGVGKTFLGSMAVKELGGKILSMYEITTMIRQSYSAKAEKTELEIVRELAEIPMLVIDEMGRTKGSESELNWLSYILDKRHTRQLPFMILTNMHLAKNCSNGNKGCDRCFERFMNNDVLSRLQQDSVIITIKAPDFRAREKKK